MTIYVINYSMYVGENYSGQEQYEWVINEGAGYFTTYEAAQRYCKKRNLKSTRKTHAINEKQRQKEHERIQKAFEERETARTLLKEAGLNVDIPTGYRDDPGPFIPKEYVEEYSTDYEVVEIEQNTEFDDE